MATNFTSKIGVSADITSFVTLAFRNSLEYWKASLMNLELGYIVYNFSEVCPVIVEFCLLMSVRV